MIKIIKKIFSFFPKFFSSRFNQRGFFIPIPFAIVGVLGALTVAGLGGNKFAKDIAFAVYILIFNIIGTLTVLFAKISAGILQWVISPKFTSLSYTNPAGNPIIKAGLGITQNLVNMILVLVLIYIAVATILRLAGHSTQKLLITFVAVALLVNFAPVIVGLIVDASNIVMNFFLKDLVAFTNLSETLGKLWRGMALMFKGQEEIDAAFFYSLTTAIFGFFLGLAFLLFAMVFILRRIAIWILVILSPLAFACYILPSTKKYWTMWWNQLIQWSIIGITAGFFLNLGTILIAEAPKYIAAPTSNDLNSGMSTLLISIVPLIFLYAGLTVGFQTSATGAGMVTSLITKGKGKFQGWAKTGGKRALGWAAGNRGRLVPPSVKAWAARQQAKGLPALGARVAGAISGATGSKTRKAAGAIVGGMVGATTLPATGALWALRRGLGHAIGINAIEAEQKIVKEAEKKYTGTIAERKLEGILNPKLSPGTSVGVLKQAIEERQIGDLIKAMENLGLTETQISERLTKIGKESLRIHPEEFKNIRDAFPHLAEKMGEGLPKLTKEAAGLTFKDAAEEKMYGGSIENSIKGSIAAKIIATMRPDKIPKMDIGAVFKADDAEAETAMHKFWTGEHVGAAARNFGRAFTEPFAEMIEANESSEKNWYKKHNPRLATYLDSSAAKGLGLQLPENPTKKGNKAGFIP